MVNGTVLAVIVFRKLPKSSDLIESNGYAPRHDDIESCIPRLMSHEAWLFVEIISSDEENAVCKDIVPSCMASDAIATEGFHGHATRKRRLEHAVINAPNAYPVPYPFECTAITVQQTHTPRC